MIVNNALINFYRVGNTYTLEVRDLDNASDEYYAVKKFTYVNDVPADEGSLVLFDNTVFIEPHNKQLNLIDGEWRLNDFISTTPTVLNITPPETSYKGVPEKGYIELRPGVNLLTPRFVSIPILNSPTSDATFKFTFKFDTPPTTTFFVDFNINSTGSFLEQVINSINDNVNSPVTASNNLGNLRLDLKTSFADRTINTVKIELDTSLDEQPVIFENTTYNFEDGPVPTAGVNIRIGTIETHFTVDGNTNLPEEFLFQLNQLEELTNVFFIERDENRINFTRKVNGDFGGKTIEVTISPPDFIDVVVENISGGIEPPGGTNVGSGLDQRTVYWYTARYRYFDGHITNTAFPEYVKTTNEARAAHLRITSERDIDGRFCLVEIFRRRDDEEFFLIDTVRPEQSTFTFIDAGRPKLQLLDDQNYVWTTKHNAQEIVRDRYVKANVEFPKRELTGSFGASANSAEDETNVVPPNISATILAQGRNNDGLETFFREIENFENESGELVLSASVNEVPADTKEVAYYAQYQNLFTNINLPFNTPEIYNQNIPSIATRAKEEEFERDTPVNPHVFLGWKRIVAYAIQDTYFTLAFDNEWAKFPQPITARNNTQLAVSGAYGANPVDVIDFDFNTMSSPDDAPDFITVDLFGTPLTYVKKFQFFEEPSFVYELAILEGLQSASVNIDLQVQLSNILTAQNLSTELSRAEIENAVVSVNGVIEKQIPVAQFTRQLPFGTSQTVTQSGLFFRNSRIYLQLPADSVFSRLTNPEINNQFYGTQKENDDISLAWLTEPNKEASFGFDILNVIETNFTEGEPLGEQSLGENRTEYTNNYGLQTQAPLIQDQQAVVYLGKVSNLDRQTRRPIPKFDFIQAVRNDGGFFANVDTTRQTLRDLNDADVQVPMSAGAQNKLYFNINRPPKFRFGLSEISTKLPVTGFTKDQVNKFSFYTLNTWNILRTPLFAEDLQQIKTKYPNQIVWSEPFIRGTNASGIRNFTFNNFLNVNPDYGQIIDIHYVNNTLLVFTNYAVGVVNVGETLTQQPSGETVVDSSNFLTGQSWALTKMNKIQRNSIRRYENILFFSDSKDVWTFDGQFRNISNGAIELAEGPHVGAIDPENKEYRISDDRRTWAYSVEMQEWFGPYTYVDQESLAYRNELLSISDNDLVKHNETNRFHNTEYDTVIESVSNDLNDPSTDKVFRKFYFDLDGSDGTEFEYYKQPGTNTVKQLADSARRNENWHVGIDSNNQNSKQIFWKFKTRAEGFVLRMLAFMYNPRIRR